MTQFPKQSTVRIGPIQPLPAVLRNLGVDPAEILAEAGMDPLVFENPDNIIPFESRTRLLNLCADKTGCAHFGLLLGERCSLESFGLVGYLALHSPDVESALRSLLRYFHLHAQGSLVILKLQEDTAFLGYHIYQKANTPVTQLIDAGVAVAFNILNELCGSGMEPLEVCFAHRKPKNQEPFRKFFRAPIRFDTEVNGIYFPRRWLGEKIQVADTELRRLLQIQIDQLERAYGSDFMERVRRVVHAAILTQSSKADQIAHLFSIHSRTLHRKLESYGTNLRDVVDRCRYDLARQTLETSDAELIVVATMLGYTDKRSFNRAFKRWSGTTPTRWRKERRLARGNNS